MTDIPTPGFVPSPGNYFAFSAPDRRRTEDEFFDNMVVSTTPLRRSNRRAGSSMNMMSVNEDGRDDEDCDPAPGSRFTTARMRRQSRRLAVDR